MAETRKQACIIGGTGFVGRQIIRALAREGYVIRIATRTPEKAYFLKTCGFVGQVAPIYCDYADDVSLNEAIKGCDVVVNCAGILYEKHKKEFTTVHAKLPERIAKICQSLGVRRLVHLSALGCDVSTSRYGQTKLAGEKAVQEFFPAVTILRPSVIFGVEDDFFNKFAKLSAFLPFLPLIGGGKTRFQPVYVGDVAKAVVASISTPLTMGCIYELGGPEILTFQEIYHRLFAQTGRKKPLLSLPWALAKLNGALLGALPCPLLTADQVESLKTNSVVAQKARSLADLGVVGTPMAAILPSYLARHRPGGRFGAKKRA